MKSTRIILALSLLLSALGAAAQDYPSRPVRLVSPFAPGGGSDIVARIMSPRLGALLNQSVLVENRAGASGNIGADYVSKARPDGYTVLLTTSAVASNPWLYKTLPFNTEKDLVPLNVLATTPLLLAAHPSAPFNTLAELVQYARKNPKSVTVATSGAGQMGHLSAELLGQAGGVELQMVHYKGTASAMQDLLGGTVMTSLVSLAGSINQIEAGKLKAIAVTSPRRSPKLPNVPTVDETYKGLSMVTWYGTFVPAGTPQTVRDRLSSTTLQALSEPAIKARLADDGMDPGGLSSAEFDAVFRNDLVRWKKFIQERGIQLED